MLIAHLSDPHLQAGDFAGPADGLRTALDRVLALDPLPACILVTGDLTEHGTAAEYAVFHDLIDRYPLPVHLVVGNHDDPAAFTAIFGPARYAVGYPGATIVVCDSHTAGTDAGSLGPEQLAWLDETLAARPDVPAFVALHHPPVPVGMPYLDAIRLTDGAALATVVARHPHVVRVLAGHLHRPVTTGFAGTLLTVAPSTYRQTRLVMRAGPGHGLVDEPAGFLLHARIAGGWATHLVHSRAY